VASGAGSGYPSLRVVGVGRALKVLHVAGHTVRRSTGKLAVHVALGTGDSDVCAGQRKLGERIVIEGCGLPRRSSVATLASLWESRLHVVRIGRFLEIGKVASHASCGRTRELSPDVTGGAIQRNVRSGQREAGDFEVIKLGAGPTIEAVTLFARSRKAGRYMTWTRGGLIILGVAGVALGG